MPNAARPLSPEPLSGKGSSTSAPFTELLLRRACFENTPFAKHPSVESSPAPAASHSTTSVVSRPTALPPAAFAAPPSATSATPFSTPSHPTAPAALLPTAPAALLPAASRSAARRSAAMLAARISGWSPWTNVTVSHPSMASMPNRTVSFLPDSSCKIACAPSVSHNAATSAWRVTITRWSNKPSVAPTTWPTSGAPQSSTMSLLSPKRAPTPDAITMHPCFNVRLSAACDIVAFAFANSMVEQARFEN